MRRRVGLLTMLLLVLGSGTVAQELSPSPDWQRVVVADEGIAVELPAGWESVPYEGPGHETVVVVFQSDSGGTCGVARMPSMGLLNVDDIVDVVVPTGHWVDLPGGYSTEQVQTAAGDAVKVAYSEARTDLDAAFWNALYFIPSDGGLYTVQCNVEYGTRTQPDDDWLSIAETFEFLPAEE